eukprot:2574898-Amphidinium_carterae.1
MILSCVGSLSFAQVTCPRVSQKRQVEMLRPSQAAAAAHEGSTNETGFAYGSAQQLVAERLTELSCDE